MKNEFLFQIEKDKGMFVATCHEPEMATQGRNLEGLLAMIRDLINCRFHAGDERMAWPIRLHFLHDPVLSLPDGVKLTQRHHFFTKTSPPQFPNDENGDVLKRMYNGGDDLTQSRIIDYCFIFPNRQQALSFAKMVDDEDSIVCISFYKDKKVWQAKVQRLMVPEHGPITAIEEELGGKARTVGGKADGWGCMVVKKKH